MEALAGSVKFLFTMVALFRILPLVWGLSFETLADSGSPSPFLWSYRPHSPPAVTPTGCYDVQRRVRAGSLLPCPLAAFVTSTSAPACSRASPPTPNSPTCTACPLIPPASTNTMTAGSCVLCSYLRPKDKLVPCGHALAVLNKVNFSPHRCISHVGSVSNWQCEYSVGEDVPDECRFAGGIDKNEWDSNECLRPGRPQSHPASGSTPDGPGPIQGRRQNPRFEQAWSRCEESAVCTQCEDLQDRASRSCAWMRQIVIHPVSRVLHGHVFLFCLIHP